MEILDQIITPEVRMVIYLMVICVVMLYILSIIYVDRVLSVVAQELWWMWAVILLFLLACFAYVILRQRLRDRGSRTLTLPS